MGRKCRAYSPVFPSGDHVFRSFVVQQTLSVVDPLPIKITTGYLQRECVYSRRRRLLYLVHRLIKKKLMTFLFFSNFIIKNVQLWFIIIFVIFH